MDPTRCRRVVAEAIRNLAAERGLTLHQLADLAAVSQSYMERVVTCRSAPTIDWVAKVASALEVNPMDLLDEKHLQQRNPTRRRSRAVNAGSSAPSPAKKRRRPARV